MCSTNLLGRVGLVLAGGGDRIISPSSMSVVLRKGGSLGAVSLTRCARSRSRFRAALFRLALQQKKIIMETRTNTVAEKHIPMIPS